MSDYESKNPKKVERKKRSGEYKTQYVKSSEHLPQVFQTPVNQKWLDASFDQMISKADLDVMADWIGSKSGKHRTILDGFLPDNSESLRSGLQLEPAIVTRDDAGKLDTLISVEDIANRINLDFDTYNYNGGYNTQGYVFNPPIDTDKFINYNQYYWTTNMPVIESVNTGTVNPDVIDTINGNILYNFSDDNYSFELQNGMLIKFDSGYGPVDGNTYLVTGVGNRIKLRLYKDTNGRIVWTDKAPNSQVIADYWDDIGTTTYSRDNLVFKTGREKIISFNATPLSNTNRSIHIRFLNADKQVSESVQDNKIITFDQTWDYGNVSTIGTFNPTTGLPELMDNTLVPDDDDGTPPNVWTSYTVNADGAYDFGNGPIELKTGDVITYSVDEKKWFKNTWHLDVYRVFLTDITDSGNRVDLITLVDAETDANGNVVQFIPGDLTPTQKYLVEKHLQGWDTENYDIEYKLSELKEYIVMDTRDPKATAWSRLNHWVHITTLDEVCKLTGTSSVDILSQDRKAKRPIIEFNSQLRLFAHTIDNQPSDTNIWKGPIDFVLDEVSEDENLSTGQTYIVPNDNKIYTVGNLIPLTVNDFDTVLVLNALTDANRTTYVNQDLYWNTEVWKVGQPKLTQNQAPLFDLRCQFRASLEDQNVYPGTDFTGSKVFAYKEATGTPDPELGFPVEYRDNGISAEIVFSNELQAQRYTYTVVNSQNQSIGSRREIPGYYSYIQRSTTKNNYIPSFKPLGAKTEIQALVENPFLPLTFDIGYSSWRTNNEFLVTVNALDRMNVEELYIDGVYHDYKIPDPKLIVGRDITYNRDITYKFHDLVGNDVASGIKLYDKDDNEITDPSIVSYIDENNDGFAETMCVTFDSNSADFYHYGYDSRPKGTIGVVDSTDSLFHKVYVNGQYVNASEYTVTGDTIKLPKNLLEFGYLVDVEYVSNDSSASSLDARVPEVHTHNAKNQIISEFTIGETTAHWQSLLQNTVGLEGQTHGKNNSHKRLTVKTNGGEIFLHNDISIMHDMTYSDKRIDINEALYEQGRDWDSFKSRFANQVRRLYQVNAYDSVSDLTNAAIDSITTTRRGGELYRKSNMAFTFDDKMEKIDLTGSNQTFTTRFAFNTDLNQKDHVYVYLTDNRDNNGQFITRILIEGVDYSVDGSEITLNVTAIGKTNLLPYVTVYWHGMDYDSYIPPSMAKLGLSFPVQPHINNNGIVGHDGNYYFTDSSRELENMLDENFDPVAAAIYDLEIRIYNGLTKFERYETPYRFYPTQSRSTWYTLQKIDNYLEKYFAMWMSDKGYESLNVDTYYDAGNPRTWNYSTIELGEHFSGNRLPGHWQGIYMMLFNCRRPDKTPWNMLGFALKPSWWDDHYSWDDVAQRAEMINAFKKGIISEPGQPVVQDTVYAMYYWDWDNNAPVDSAGEFREPHLVLTTEKFIATQGQEIFELNLAANWDIQSITVNGNSVTNFTKVDEIIEFDTPLNAGDVIIISTESPVNASQPFVFGDWGPVEIIWRNTAVAQAMTVSAVLKLNVTEGFTRFFQPGIMRRTSDPDVNTDVLESTSNLFNAQDIYYHGEVYGRSLVAAKVKSSTDEIGSDSIFRVLSSDSEMPALTDINLDGNGKLTHVNVTQRGNKFTTTAVSDFVNLGNVPANFSFAEVEIELAEVPHYALGINQAQYNAIQRNQHTVNLEQKYKNTDTQLLQKVGGFTSKNLIEMSTDSSIDGPVRLYDGDYEIVMVEGTPIKLNVANIIKITRKAGGFEVNSVSSNKQRFEFNEPVVNGANPYVNQEVVNGIQVRKYKQFSTVTSTAEFGTVFAKIQDTYNFIRGVRQFAEQAGIVFQDDKDALALMFAQWAASSQQGDTYTVGLGSSVTYNVTHGFIAEFDSVIGNINTVLNNKGQKIDVSQLSVARSNNSVEISLKNNEILGSIGFAEVDYEHGILLANTTQFNRKIFDDIVNARFYKMWLRGERTKGWVGSRTAPGYLVHDDSITPNFDTTAHQIDYFYRDDIELFNRGQAKAQQITNGNFDRDWVNALNPSDSTMAKLYKGIIREKGTNQIINKLNRVNLVNTYTSTVNAYEEWMFKNGYLGDMTQRNSVEVEFKQAKIQSEPYTVNFATTNTVFVNGDASDVLFSRDTYAENLEKQKLPTAGPILHGDATYIVPEIDNLETIFDNSADYANVPTWNGQTSYKRGDYIRYNGHMWKCNVDFIGYTRINQEILVTGAAFNPVFEYRDTTTHPNDPNAVIDGVSVWFDETTISYNTAVATGTTIDPSIPSPSDIVINNSIINLTKTQQVEVLDPSSPYGGDPYAYSTGTTIADNTGLELVIDGVTISLETPTHLAGSALTGNDIVGIINDADVTDITAELALSGTAIAIVKSANGDINASFTIGASIANAELGFVAMQYNAVTTFETQHVPMDADYIVNAINLAQVTNVSASNVNNAVVVSELPTANTTGASTLDIGGTAGPLLGLPANTLFPSSVNQVTSTAQQAVDKITQVGIPGVTVILVNSNIQISSTNQTLNLGPVSPTNEFNQKAGIAGGDYFVSIEEIPNVFDSDDWIKSDAEDSALFNIWVLDDSKLVSATNTTNGIQSKYFGWNLLQVQNTGIYQNISGKSGMFTTDDDPTCSICAGTMSSDGNDARVTVNIDHNLSVGDYVMLVNTTTVPNIDGIHRVTRVGDISEPKSFYIDRFIEECGSAPQVFTLRSARFTTHDARTASQISTSHNWNHGDLAFTDKSSSGVISTTVHSWDANSLQWNIVPGRQNFTRAANDVIENVVIYDGVQQQTQLQLEVYDPIRGIIPGIADIEIDQKSPVDIASYTHSTDSLYNVSETSAWAEDALGKTWWDTSTVVYYDYDQSDNNYRRNFWGKQLPTSSIDVYEWTKSSVPPDEWENAKMGNISIFGQTAEGEVYSVYDENLQESLYYYSQVEEYNKTTVSYSTVYYFWVKNKTTLPNTNRKLSVLQIANIVSDPTANGISWVAAISATDIIVSNVHYYTNDNTVLQLNLKETKSSHSSWDAVKEEKDLISDYWFIGLRDNLTGLQSGTGIEFPNTALHKFNRYGDNREIGQGWFLNTLEARRQAVSSANVKLKNINVVQDLSLKWNRTIGKLGKYSDIGVHENNTPNWSDATPDSNGERTRLAGDRVISESKVYEAQSYFVSNIDNPRQDIEINDWKMVGQVYDLAEMWDWADYTHPSHPQYRYPSIKILSKKQLEAVDNDVDEPVDPDVNESVGCYETDVYETDDTDVYETVDPDVHKTVELKLFDQELQLDRSEIYNYIDGEWLLTMKKNSTIQFNDFIYNKDNLLAWDTAGWDSKLWDSDTKIFAYYMVEALRNDIFILNHQDNFNKFFFDMIKFTISSQKQVDWVYKTTYIQLEIESQIEQRARKYIRNGINEIQGYVNTVKPYHTKVRNVFDKHSITEDLMVDIQECRAMEVTLKFDVFDQAFDGPIYGSLFNNTAGETYTGLSFTDTEYDDIHAGPDFLDYNIYNYTQTEIGKNAHRRNVYIVEPEEHLDIKVLTNTSGSATDSDTRTFVYQQDNNKQVVSYSLVADMSTQVIAQVDDTVEVADISLFDADGGELYINGEIASYIGIVGNTLYGIKRATYAKEWAIGDTIISLSDARITTLTNTVQIRVHEYNDSGKSILDPTSTNIEPIQLQATGSGIVF